MVLIETALGSLGLIAVGLAALRVVYGLANDERLWDALIMPLRLLFSFLCIGLGLTFVVAAVLLAIETGWP